MSLEELQRLVLLAFRFGEVAGFQLDQSEGSQSATISFKSREALSAFLEVLPGERCSFTVFGMSVLIRLD